MPSAFMALFHGVNPISFLKLKRGLPKLGIECNEAAVMAHLVAIKGTDEQADDLLAAAKVLAESKTETDFEHLTAVHLLGHIKDILAGRPLDKVWQDMAREGENQLAKQGLSGYDQNKISAVVQWIGDYVLGIHGTPPTLREAIDKFELSEADVRYMQAELRLFSILQKNRERYFCRMRRPFVVAAWLVTTILGIMVIYSTYFDNASFEAIHGHPDTTGIIGGLIFIAIGQTVLIGALMHRKRAKADPWDKC